MIFDSLKHAPNYYAMHKNFELAFKFLCETNLESISLGRHDILNNDCFALVGEYETKPQESIVWEAHRNYIDIQYVVSGEEIMGFAPEYGFEVITPYDEEKDFAFYSGEGNFLTVPKGYFTIFFPQDIHAPQLQKREAIKVRKVVVKILL